mmetsp:Transcript_12986/g.19568  ORF Transcript_12986/g.19568 Transcript_12986/m.19568 type:complete len:694 (+) Transcript_12986:209-2290(+)|eukprot:CAMPEP_0185032968 /NCGR_PEP_ID=MMETSP1103-20130426/21538_1 /TAXON_ID=36769 /ORGANISM="Paraphysomonas bandaiensis, Strain Caron Lab Isolate" /LENGTH=693 /DNA_ID=CAMNT_0027569073 /DNA_START=128 /DNA_END=2209 /DNA_ORIENTATION=-
MSEIRRDVPLFNETLNLHTTSASQEECEVPLTLKILPGNRQHGNQLEKFLRFEITDDDDLYFLYTLDVGEHDFHNLKRDQRLVIDFSGFSKKFIDLVLQCIQRQSISTSSYTSTYMAKLDLTSGVFSVIEVNEFNHVNHLSLQFRPGTDAAIKSYLASSLKLALSKCAGLSNEVMTLKEECNDLERSGSDMSAELGSVRDAHAREMQSMSNSHAQEKNILQQQHMDAVETLRRRYESEANALRESAAAEYKEISDKVGRLEEMLSDVNKAKMELEFSLRRSESELEKLKPEAAMYKSSMTESQNALRDTEKQRAQLEQALARSEAKRESLEIQLQDKDEIIKKASSLRTAADEARQEALKQVELYEGGMEALQEKLKTAVAEISRGNESIRKLQEESSSYRDKLNTKNEVIRKQESVIKDLRERISDMSRHQASMEDSLKISNQRQELLERELSDAKKSIAEGADMVQRNQEVINYLNELVTSLQLGGTSTVPGGAWSTPVADTRHQSSPRTQSYSQKQYSPETGGHYIYEGEESGGDKYRTDPSPSSIAKVPFSRVKETGRDSRGDPGSNVIAGRGSVERVRLFNSSFDGQVPGSSPGYSSGVALPPAPVPHKSPSGLTRGYYDGLMESPTKRDLHKQKDSSGSPSGISGITRSAKKKVYSWQLDDFGREDEGKSSRAMGDAGAYPSLLSAE